MFAGAKRVRFEEPDAPTLRRTTYQRGQQDAAKRQQSGPKKRSTAGKSKKDQSQALVMVCNPTTALQNATDSSVAVWLCGTHRFQGSCIR